MSDTERRLADEIAERRHGDDCTASDLANRLMPFIAAIEREAAARALAEVRSTIGAYQENGVWAFDQAVACIERARAEAYRQERGEQ